MTRITVDSYKIIDGDDMFGDDGYHEVIEEVCQDDTYLCRCDVFKAYVRGDDIGVNDFDV